MIILILIIILIILSKQNLFPKIYFTSIDNFKLKAIRLDYLDYNYNNKYHNFMKNSEIASKIPIFKYNNKFKINKRVCISICVRDCEKYISKSFKKVEDVASCFSHSCIIFYENGSSDNSRNILKEYCSNNTNSTLFYEDYNIKEYPRTVRLARGRNICLNTAKKLNPDLYIAMDFDDVISKLDKKDIIKSFEINLEWDAIFANQNRIYYDLWALRTYDDWMNYDCWEASGFMSTKKAVTNHFRKVPKNKIVEVISAFGGLGIYKFDSVKNFFYYGFKNETGCCEHVHLHKQMTKNKKKLFIIGSLINN
jgi:hypothetical protein